MKLLKLSLFSLPLMLLLPLHGCLPKGAVTPEDIFERATDLQQEQDYDSAIAEFQKLVERFPQSEHVDNAQLEIGNSLRMKGDYEGAIQAYEKIKPESEVYDQSRLLIGDCYLALGKRGEAEEVYEELIERYPYLNNEFALKASRRLKLIKRIGKLEREVREGKEDRRDNALFEIAKIYMEELGLYDVALRRFEELREKFPESELADDAMLMMGECYWRMAKYETPPKVDSKRVAAFVRYYYIVDRYPQLAEMKLYSPVNKPHWPAGYPVRDYEKFYGKGLRYDNYYLEVRFLLSKYPDLRSWSYTDFLPPSYGKAIQTWNELMEKYPNTDAAARCPKLVAERLLELGKAFYNAGAPGFSSVLLHESLAYYPLPEAHIYLAYFYADARSYSIDPTSTYHKIRVFRHLKEAEKLVPPDSEMAAKIKQLKILMNYRMRVEVLEAKVNRLSHR